jgi:hypothetical protein
LAAFSCAARWQPPACSAAVWKRNLQLHSGCATLYHTAASAHNACCCICKRLAAMHCTPHRFNTHKLEHVLVPCICREGPQGPGLAQVPLMCPDELGAAGLKHRLAVQGPGLACADGLVYLVGDELCTAHIWAWVSGGHLTCAEGVCCWRTVVCVCCKGLVTHHCLRASTDAAQRCGAGWCPCRWSLRA